MRITRIARIKDHRIFHDFNWPPELLDFGQFNLIYGWNGSGKTALSNLLRHMEKREEISEGEVHFQIDNRVVIGTQLGDEALLPRVRVFNKDFIDANVFASFESIMPIFFIGEDSVEKQKKIESLKVELNAKTLDIARTDSDKSRAESVLDNFCIQQARMIRELLRSSGRNPYNNYDKARFRSACEAISLDDAAAKLLDHEQKNALKQQIQATSKEAVPEIAAFSPDFTRLQADVKGILDRTIVSQVIDELASDGGLAQWVREGIAYHTGANETQTCRFCGQPLSHDRLAKLQGHFNDQYARFLQQIDDKITELESIKAAAAQIKLVPPKAALYEHLWVEYSHALSVLEAYIEQVTSRIEALICVLGEKRLTPFEAVRLQSSMGVGETPDVNAGSNVLSQIAALIDRHNSMTSDFDKVVRRARRQLEDCLVSEAVGEYTTRNRAIRDASLALDAMRSEMEPIKAQIAELETRIIEHRRPAEELNAELCSYLGRKELTFQVKDAGYVITRCGLPASNLSEGEKTAIAFLYFLKSLQDRSFNIREDVIVIDDPVSSLDLNSLFCSFGLMKERTKDAGQLFVLTHNAGFFRQVKNWFNHLPGQGKRDVRQRPARFYMISTSIENGTRTASLAQLDPLLHRFESEYHYLFKLVYEEACRTPSTCGLEQFYGLPNVARRLLEAFLAFRYPSQTGELRQQLDSVQFDASKKSRVLRFLHTYSHEGRIDEPEHDTSILAETPQVLKDILELLKSEDPKHYAEMENIVKRIPVDV